jgi:hypothetical protein
MGSRIGQRLLVRPSGNRHCPFVPDEATCRKVEVSRLPADEIDEGRDTTNLDKLRQVPMLHWDKPANDPDVMQAGPLESWEWQSGVVVMPAEDFDRVFK